MPPPEPTPGTPPARTCPAGGYLVGPTFLVHDDPAYFQTPASPGMVGCNRLRCRLCGTDVRQRVGFADADPAAATPETVAAICRAADWAASPLLRPDPESRLYACGCSAVVIKAQQVTPMPGGNWTCRGHPPPADPSARGDVLPALGRAGCETMALFLANQQFAGTPAETLFVTFTDGTGQSGQPSQIHLGGDGTGIDLWDAGPPSLDNPMPSSSPLDLGRVATAVVRLADGTMRAF